jgi:dTDP-4-dehydrorhamnose reductase
MKKVLITGAQGLLGRQMASTFRDSGLLHVFSVSRSNVDLMKRDALFEYFQAIQPDYIVNCAGYTNVEKAEIAQGEAFSSNVTLVENLTDYCKDSGSVLYHFSSDYVFGGEYATPIHTDAPRSPLNYYGFTKMAAEDIVFNAIPGQSVVIRTSWLYGRFGKSFVSQMIDKVNRNESARVVSDQFGSPTNTLDLSERVLDLVVNNTNHGLFHIVGESETTWFEVAEYIFGYFDRKEKLFAISTGELDLIAKRPKYSYLENSSLDHFGAKQMGHWRDSLKNYLESGVMNFES